MARRQGIITLVLALTSDFTITDAQRRRTKRTDTKPWLDFDIKPYGCRPGATYVLRWSKPDKLLCGDGAVIQIPRQPVWWLTVTAVQRHRKGFWRVRYDTTDRRDPTLFLKAGGGYTTSRWSAIDELAVPPDDHTRQQVRDDTDHLRRLARAAEQLRRRSQHRRLRARPVLSVP